MLNKYFASSLAEAKDLSVTSRFFSNDSAVFSCAGLVIPSDTSAGSVSAMRSESSIVSPAGGVLELLELAEPSETLFPLTFSGMIAFPWRGRTLSWSSLAHMIINFAGFSRKAIHS